MRKVLPIKIEFEYEDAKENEEIVQRMYNRIFELAKQIVLNKRKSERKEFNHSKNNYEKIHNLCEDSQSGSIG